MWPSPPIDAVETIAWQVRRVRRRWNLRALQRALYLLIATAAGAATSVLVLALAVDVRWFGAGLGGVAAVTLVAGVVVVRAVGRGWMGRAPAARWIDRRAGLDGRLTTLVALPGHSRRALLFPLLVEQNVVRLAAWEPARLVRRPVPLLALAAAIVACSALLLLLVLAPRLRPPPPEIVRSDRPVEGVEPADDLDAVPHRMLVAPLRGRQGERPGDGGARVATAGEGGGRPRAPRVPASIRGAIRRRLWGEAPTPIEIAGLERGQTAGDESADGRRDASVPGEGSGGAGDDRERAGDARPVADDASRSTEEAPGAGASRAGPGTAPDLFGTPGAGPAGGGRFALGLGVRVHGPGSSPRPPSGEAPPGAPDAQPALAPGQREASPFHRMPVPPELEPIVRVLFAHQP